MWLRGKVPACSTCVIAVITDDDCIIYALIKKNPSRCYIIACGGATCILATGTRCKMQRRMSVSPAVVTSWISIVVLASAYYGASLANLNVQRQTVVRSELYLARGLLGKM